MSNMVGRKVHLDSIFIDGAFWDVHYTCTVYYDVDSWDVRPGKDLIGSSTDRLLAREVKIERTIFDIGEPLLESVDALSNFGRGAACNNEIAGRLGSLQDVLVDRRI